MNDLGTELDQLTFEERELIQKIEVCEGCISAVFDYILENGDPTAVQIGEYILSSIHTIDKDLQTELLHIRLEKSFLESKIKLMNTAMSN
mgnify:CR=1 FL=1